MIKEGILKNYPKFKVLKMPSGIDLKTVKFTNRKKDKNTSSTSTNTYGNYWFNLKDGKAIFKTFDSSYKREIKEIRMINELICQNLASQIGIKHALYEPAHMGNDYGLVSYNIIGKNQKLVTLAKFLSYDYTLGNNLVDISTAINFYKELGYNFDNEIIFDIYKIIVFDALTLQTDRNNFNINFIYDKTSNTYLLSPLFDNEYAFNGELINYGFMTNIGNYNDLIKRYSFESKFLNIDNESSYDVNAYSHNLVNICNIAKVDKKFKDFLLNALKNFNINSAISYVEELGYKISDEYKDYINQLTNQTKSLFKTELSKPVTKETAYLYEEHIKL